MKKRMVTTTAALTIAGALLGSSFQPAFAEPDIKKQLDDVQEQQKENVEKAEKTESDLTKLDSELKDLQAELDELKQEEETTQQNLDETEAELAEIEADIESLEEEIAVMEERIGERRGLLEERAVAAYESGGEVSYLEVLLGAKSFGDFIERVSAISTIAKHDQEMLDEYIADEKELQAKKEEVEEKQADVEAQKAELEALKEDLVEQTEEIDELQAELKEKEEELQAQLGDIMSEEESLQKQEEALEAELKAWEEEQERLKEEEERKAREAEEQAAKEQEAAKAKETEESSEIAQAAEKPQAGDDNNNEKSNQEQEAAPSVESSGAFVRPATGSITSNYGQRWGRMHWGIDIGKNGRAGDVPIVSVLDGTVASTEYRSDFGNWVVVTHQIDGKQLTTVYAHLERIDVSPGDRVKAGQQLGLMGNTGRSTGPHLHFEVHEGPFNWDRSNAVDPMKYM
ncbi:murein hydrolase activator EnvC family protein [Shouchella rhizosphaerae]|uniref:murein hydrolase activator EnvC family protein n=1 Tax=Shouchella rhizosphaerae TaxID=866786 RepID=UPI003F7D3216